MTEAKISSVARGYIECALWSSTDDSNRPMDLSHDASEIAPDSLAVMIGEADAFYAEHAELLATCGATCEQVGHDFWLTRNHHGAGFWDREEGIYTKAAAFTLTAAAHDAGERDLYVGDDGCIHQFPEYEPGDRSAAEIL